MESKEIRKEIAEKAREALERSEAELLLASLEVRKWREFTERLSDDRDNDDNSS